LEVGFRVSRFWFGYIEAKVVFDEEKKDLEELHTKVYNPKPREED
jgi:hypothetical protein